MASKLKRDQLPPQKANNWRKSLKEEEKLTLNMKVPQLILQKETYKILAGENENRVRIYLGLEPESKNGKLELCAFAVSAFLLGSGDVYVDYETPVYKLEKKNVDYSDDTEAVIESIKRYKSWRAGELESDAPGADVRQYIYPCAYLLTKFELHEIFNVQNKKEAEIEFGISKVMSAMVTPISAEDSVLKSSAEGSETYNEVLPCPPNCDDGSPYNV